MNRPPVTSNTAPPNTSEPSVAGRLTAILRTGERVEVAEIVPKFNRQWQKLITDYVLTSDGRRIEGWEITHFEDVE
jgi:hypothetical protein